jgi:hypothetical protein
MFSRKKILLLFLASIFSGAWYLISINEYGPGFSYGGGDFHFKRHDDGVCKLKIDGRFNFALEELFNKSIKELEKYRCKTYTLELLSGGGILGVALRIGDIVKEKKMTTIVLENCKSACMYVFIAGQSRVASEEASLGLHQAIDVETKKCIDPNQRTKDNITFFKSVRAYINNKLGSKSGYFFSSKDNLASCNEMLILDNKELYKKGVITKPLLK